MISSGVYLYRVIHWVIYAVVSVHEVLMENTGALFGEGLYLYWDVFEYIVQDI